ncbi:hypothetical protein AC1031_003948 [Aphanomyces cochlioides]|nr:hypothetical protein AC1031_003948 [Aphanomyces cochlioides]
MTSQPRPLRILCLHGGRSSSTVISLQVSGFVQAFGPGAEFEELDGPFPASGPPEQDILDLFGDEEDYFEWWDADDHHDQAYPGWQKGLAYLQRHVEENGPYDVILGFSQGAMITTLMTAHYIHAKKTVPYKAIVLVSGMWPVDGMPDLPVNEATGKPVVDFPSFHILGSKDHMYVVGLDQVSYFAESSRHVFTHNQGHRFPPLPQSRGIYQEIVQKLHAVCTPVQP